MNVCIIWAAVLMIAALACAVASPLFSWVDDPEAPNQASRLQSLDGLRGYLALFVAIHHGTIYYAYLTAGTWEAPPSSFFNQLGQASVGLFFIITGYLFWQKILKANGALDFSRLLVGRAFRIGPVFIALMVGLMGFSLLSSGLNVTVPTKVLTLQVLQNLALGVLPVSDFNGVSIAHLVAGVTWTLPYEWEFYFSLPILAALAWRRNLTLPMIVGMLAAVFVFSAMTHALGLIIIMLFLTGTLCATLENQGIKAKLSPRVCSAIAIPLLVAVYCLFPNTLSRPAAVLFLGASFYFIIMGADFFGLLRLKASLRLGAISYDLYLCHGAALAAAFGITPLRAWALESPFAYWLVIAATLFVAMGAALLLHVLVERPGIALGKRLVSKAQSPSPHSDEQIILTNRHRPIPAE